jgi:hypothetical protein
MDGHERDLCYPECCAYCPHVHPVSESCDHDERESFADQLSREEPCPVFEAEKTAAMAELLRTLEP